jgi:hypothetical protein
MLKETVRRLLDRLIEARDMNDYLNQLLNHDEQLLREHGLRVADIMDTTFGKADQANWSLQ